MNKLKEAGTERMTSPSWLLFQESPIEVERASFYFLASMTCGEQQNFTSWPHVCAQTSRQISVRSRDDPYMFHGHS